MQVCTTLIDASGHIFERRTTHDALSVIGAAKPSQKVVATKGKAWADQSLQTLGRGLAKAMLAGKKQRFDQAILDLLVAVWLIDSIFGKLTPTSFSIATTPLRWIRTATSFMTAASWRWRRRAAPGDPH